MASTDMRDLLRLMGEQLQPLDVEELKHILQDSLSGEFTSRPLYMFLSKGVLKICSKFTGENPCRSMISINWLCNVIEITLWHGCSLVNLLHIFGNFHSFCEFHETFIPLTFELT